MCEICKKNTIEDADQLITCTSCDKKYYSYCIDGKRIPFDTLTEKNRAEHDKYVCCNAVDPIDRLQLYMVILSVPCVKSRRRK